MIYLCLERLLAPCTDRIVCISEAERQSALREHIAPEGKLALIPNGIDVEAVRNAVGLSRESLGIADDAFVVGMIGRLSSQKAPDVFVRAAKLVHDEVPNSAFIIVGSGEEEEAVRAFAEENGLQLVVTGWTDEPYSYLKVFDVAMLLSRWEGFGLAVVEYMAAEKNVVASRTDAIPTLVEDGVDGLLVDVDSPQEAADKVLWLYRHPKEAAAMRRKALKKVMEKYDISRVINQHMEMFNKLIEGGVNRSEYIRINGEEHPLVFIGYATLQREERRVAA